MSAKNVAFLALLALQAIGLLAYTALTGTQHGWDFLSVATANAASMTWNGQFALDFSCYLALSGLWVMWRQSFRPQAVVIGLVAMILGIVFFAPYVFFLTLKAKGDIAKVLLGDQE
jgi:hypothetical protein